MSHNFFHEAEVFIVSYIILSIPQQRRPFPLQKRRVVVLISCLVAFAIQQKTSTLKISCFSKVISRITIKNRSFFHTSYSSTMGIVYQWHTLCWVCPATLVSASVIPFLIALPFFGEYNYHHYDPHRIKYHQSKGLSKTYQNLQNRRVPGYESLSSFIKRTKYLSLYGKNKALGSLGQTFRKLLMLQLFDTTLSTRVANPVKSKQCVERFPQHSRDYVSPSQPKYVVSSLATQLKILPI